MHPHVSLHGVREGEPLPAHRAEERGALCLFPRGFIVRFHVSAARGETLEGLVAELAGVEFLAGVRGEVLF